MNWERLSNGVELGRAETAREFFEALRPSNDLWWEDDEASCPWVFRGHGDASWKLLPTAWRDGNAVIEHSKHEAEARFDRIKPRQESRWLWGNHMSAEYSFGFDTDDLFRRLTIETTAEWLPVWDFIGRCDALGMHNPFGTLPPDSDQPDWLCDPGLPLSGDDLLHRFSNMIPALALAQHHKIPTRLLDWTRNPLTAIYFATESKRVYSQLAVWALHRRRAANVRLDPINFVDGPHIRPVHCAIAVVKPSTQGNPFLTAQSGIFTTLIGAGCYFVKNNGHRPSLEEVVAAAATPDTVLRKLVLPLNEFEALQNILRREGIMKSLLMPTMDNIASEVLELWSSRQASR